MFFIRIYLRLLKPSLNISCSNLLIKYGRPMLSHTIQFCLRYKRVTFPSLMSGAFMFGTAQKDQSLANTVTITDASEKSDELYKKEMYQECYDYMKNMLTKSEFQHADMFWRYARILRQMAQDYSHDAVKTKEYTYEAFEYAKKAVELDNDSAGAHKWYGILLDATARFEGTKKRIQNSYLVKEHLTKSIERCSQDAGTLHSLGVWCFEFADLPWYQQKLAAAFFATPPQSTYDEALKYLLAAEKVSPQFYSYNLLYLGKSYQRLKMQNEARHYLQMVLNYDGDGNEDRQAKKEAAELLRSC